MRGGVDAARQAGDDAEAGVAQIARQRLREFGAGGGGIARADDGDQWPRQNVALAAHGKQRRRIVDHLQPRRIVRLAQRDEFDAARARGLEFAFGVFARTDARRTRSAAAPRQAWKRGERAARAAVIIDQVAKGARPDIVAADQPQPVEPLLLASAHAVAQTLAPAADSRQHRRSQRAQSSTTASAFCADLAFAAVEQAADIGAVHDPGEDRQHEEQRRRSGCASAKSARGVQRAGDQCRKRRIAEEGGERRARWRQKISAAGQ